MQRLIRWKDVGGVAVAGKATLRSGRRATIRAHNLSKMRDYFLDCPI